MFIEKCFLCIFLIILPRIFIEPSKFIECAWDQHQIDEMQEREQTKKEENVYRM